ncbi:Pnap_2097 family protein [Pseudooceanicola nanhaiensis]|uniref:Pnap_2097 family protein n=1 Tax=Pseudooceanicola nanhaiensis TaxID=375761 RepID=UPI001CD29361|nr:Pnap_2097 family protein [Pseudooceanicola nanhaiensis]MCA0921429.1 hypothetical protein [Pseudooceanicola nanhaiensis]
MNACARLEAHPPQRAIVLRDRLLLGMQQLAPYGLSEQWLLRDAGDRHWALIAKARNQQGIAFHDAEGHPVYAAFCATELRLAPPRGPLLGTTFEVTSSLHQIGPNRLGSEHVFQGAEGPLGSLRMISCFLRHDGSGSNRRLLRSTLSGLGSLAPATPGLLRQHGAARTMARHARQAPMTGPLRLHYQPVPALDFNAVGLLYFPTFSAIAERARPGSGALAMRDVVYLGNLDPGQEITVHDAPAAPYPDPAACLSLSAGPHRLALVRTAHHPTARGDS